MTEGRQGSFFFFSSRRRHTRLQGDWSSDVCSSDPGAGYRKPVLELLQAFSQATDIRAEASFGNMKQIETQARRSEEHTSELQSPCNLVCRLLLEKKISVSRPATSLPSSRTAPTLSF